MDKEYGVIKNGKPARVGVKVANKNEMNSMNARNSTTNEKMMKFLGVGLIAVVMFAVGVYSGREFDVNLGGFVPEAVKNVDFVGDTQGKELEEVNFDHFWDVWKTLRSRYVDSEGITEKEMFEGSIKGFVDSFGDSATVYLDAEETAMYQDSTSGNYFSGIGAELGYKNGQIVVISPIKGSPAIAAGVRPSDIILAVDGEKITSDMNIYDVVLVIRGEEGTEVTLTVLHQDDVETTDITITRGQITIPSMEYALSKEDENVGVIDLARFTESSLLLWQEKWDEVVQKHIDSGAKGLIIDLRGNPGGFLNGAIYAASDFLEKGTVVAQTEDQNGDIDSFTVSREGLLLDMPVVLLVNEGSASASEILAGGLQKNGRAVVVGTNSYGKGTAQSIVDFPDGSSLHVTVMKWLLPDGSWLNHDNTITPDYEVEFTDEQFKDGLDPQMDKAMELILKEI